MARMEAESCFEMDRWTDMGQAEWGQRRPLGARTQ